jgi:cytochrome oxidase Cu insertion factor (SCO1/SenC/PrrC family)
MSGMGTGLNANDPTIVSAFRRALLHQGLAVLAIFILVALAWSLLRSMQLRAATGESGSGQEAARFVYAEAPARRVLRVSFGLLWIFDGVLQGQASMPLGMGPQVIQPAAAASPAWVQHLDNSMARIWTYHPIAAPTAAVWIQVGIGLWLLAAPRGNWSRLGGVASVGWGAIVWIFGEAFGQIFAPGLTWLFGAPGAVLFYCVAGALIALPERLWMTPVLGKLILRVNGVFFVGMAVLQAWPGRGFWRGQSSPHAAAGSLTIMVQQMAQAPQPHLLASWAAAFADFDAAHGWAVNLFAVMALGTLGAAFLTAQPRIVRVAVVAGVVFCLADWVLIEDLGFMGGVGTDPNSMIPIALILVAGYLATTRTPVPNKTVTPSADPVAAGGSRWQRALAQPTYTFRSIATLGAVGITLVGAAPMAFAAINPNADAILTQAVNGPPQAENAPAPGFRLVDQFGQPVSLASLEGKAVAITLLDDVCTTDCPVIAQEFRQADQMLGAKSHGVELVAIVANPLYRSVAYTRAFDTQERLATMPNWLFLTGTLPQLQQTWKNYAIAAEIAPAGGMILHNDVAYVIDANGRTRTELNLDPGPGTASTKSSFAVELSAAAEHVMRPS